MISVRTVRAAVLLKFNYIHKKFTIFVLTIKA